MVENLVETKQDAIHCLDKLLRRLFIEYDDDVSQEFIEAVFSIGKKNLMEKDEVRKYIEKYMRIIDKYRK